MIRALLLVSFMAACTVGEVGGGPASTPDASGGGGGGGGGGGQTDGGGTAGSGSLTVTFTTSPTAGAVFAPNNVLAVWVTNQAGTFVKTIDRWAAVRIQYLINWNIASGGNDVDAVSGATRTSHATPETKTWMLKDRNGQIIPDGTYTIHMETADQNATSAGQNNEGTFTFVKGPQPQMQTGLSNGGFSNVSITFTP